MTQARPNRDPETMDVIDNLQRTSGQLVALLNLVTGADGSEVFRSLPATQQDDLLELSWDLALRQQEAVGRL